MLSTLFLKRFISFSRFSFHCSLSLFALAVDSDGDGVDDIQDSFPNDASKQYLSFGDALSGIEDPSLRGCIDNQWNGTDSAGSVTAIDQRFAASRAFSIAE